MKPTRRNDNPRFRRAPDAPFGRSNQDSQNRTNKFSGPSSRDDRGETGKRDWRERTNERPERPERDRDRRPADARGAGGRPPQFTKDRPSFGGRRDARQDDRGSGSRAGYRDTRGAGDSRAGRERGDDKRPARDAWRPAAKRDWRDNATERGPRQAGARPDARQQSTERGSGRSPQFAKDRPSFSGRRDARPSDRGAESRGDYRDQKRFGDNRGGRNRRDEERPARERTEGRPPREARYSAPTQRPAERPRASERERADTRPARQAPGDTAPPSAFARYANQKGKKAGGKKSDWGKKKKQSSGPSARPVREPQEVPDWDAAESGEEVATQTAYEAADRSFDTVTQNGAEPITEERRPGRPGAGGARAARKREIAIGHEAGTILVDRRAVARLRAGNPWVYRSDIVSAEGVAPAAVAPVVDDRGRSFGTALYSAASQIAVRMISSEPVADGEPLLKLIRERIRAAVEYRSRVVKDTDAYRLVFSEADLLPGLIVDRYNDLLSVQVATQAMDREDVREAVLTELAQQCSPAGIVERVEPRIRELEQLPPRESGVLQGDRGTTTFTMNGLRFQFDALAGQKTGAFLDQRENYQAAAQQARGEALDVFCYQGGFALHLARVCDRVTGVDVSRPALETAEQNAGLNADQLGGREIEWIEANAFDLMRDYSDAGRKYDTIVLDPPAFAKTKKTLETAIRGYKELNLRALKMLRPGGALITCSCSFHVSEADFMQMLAEAAADAHRSVRVVEKRTQSKDHPVLLALPESQYLKCVIAIAQ